MSIGGQSCAPMTMRKYWENSKIVSLINYFRQKKCAMKNMKLAWNPHDMAKWHCQMTHTLPNDVAKHHHPMAWPNSTAKWHGPSKCDVGPPSCSYLQTLQQYTHHFILTALQSPKAMTLWRSYWLWLLFRRKTHTRVKSQTHQWRIQWTVIGVTCVKCPLPTLKWVLKPKNSSSIRCPHTKWIVPNDGGANSILSLLVLLILPPLII